MDNETRVSQKPQTADNRPALGEFPVEGGVSICGVRRKQTTLCREYKAYQGYMHTAIHYCSVNGTPISIQLVVSTPYLRNYHWCISYLGRGAAEACRGRST